MLQPTPVIGRFVIGRMVLRAFGGSAALLTVPPLLLSASASGDTLTASGLADGLSVTGSGDTLSVLGSSDTLTIVGAGDGMTTGGGLA